MTATISITVPALTDNAIWFANAAAWSNYWEDISGAVTIDPIATTTYTSSPYDNTLQPAQITIDSDVFVLATFAQLSKLITEVSTLNTSYQVLRAALYNAGLITNA